MTEHGAEKLLPEFRRKEIFLALVDAQDREMTVPLMPQPVGAINSAAAPGGATGSCHFHQAR